MTALPPGWTVVGGDEALRREYELADFSAAVELISAIAPVANALDHHPDLRLTRYRRLEVLLTTHSAGGKVTEKDYALAAAIEELPKKLRHQ